MSGLMAQHLWILLGALAVYWVTFHKPPPEVTAPAGRFRGKVLTSHSGVNYASYRGIPYALPPTGDRRFALPVPHPAIEGLHDAGQFGPMCLQHWKGLKLGREDCLHLNVFTPLSGETTTDDDLKKVLVFIHGGGFVVGSSNPYLPGDLVTRGDLVVVTLNYRFGWMGFLRGNSCSLPGNVAFWDQLLALNWVKDNIQYFGGDPMDVTLSGESVGSMSASVLSLSPLTKGLFSKVIQQSGAAAIFPAPPHTDNDLLQVAASRFGCSVDSLPGHEDDVVTCLKQVPAEDFIDNFDFPLLFGGVSSEDNLIPRPFSRALNDSTFLSEVGYFDRDYLMSVTADEGYILRNSVFGIVNTTSLASASRDLISIFGVPVDVISLLLEEYVKLFGNIDKSVSTLIGDYFFLRVKLYSLTAFNRRDINEIPVPERHAYLMSFDHIPKYEPSKDLVHALDLCYLFDLTPEDLMNSFYFTRPEGEFDDDDLEMKANYIDLVVDFVKTGNPGVRLGREKDVAWPPYDRNHKSCLRLSLQPSVEEDVLRTRREIWKRLVPQWLEE